MNVTEQVQTNTLLRESQAREQTAQRQAQQRQDLYQVFEQAPTAIVLMRGAGHRIDYCNAAFAALFPPEAGAGALLGQPIAEVYPRLKATSLLPLLDAVYTTGEAQVTTDFTLTELQLGRPRYLTPSHQPYHEQGRLHCQ